MTPWLLLGFRVVSVGGMAVVDSVWSDRCKSPLDHLNELLLSWLYLN
jgi:hypothetical protein